MRVRRGIWMAEHSALSTQHSSELEELAAMLLVLIRLYSYSCTIYTVVYVLLDLAMIVCLLATTSTRVATAVQL